LIWEEREEKRKDNAEAQRKRREERPKKAAYIATPTLKDTG
jgi:hypothetical protein